MRPGVTVVVPSIPPRATLLVRSLGSVYTQERLPDAVIVTIDHDKEGAGPNRTRALNMVDTEWVAFLDDDDQMKPEHLAKLMACAEETGADLVYPWMHVVGGGEAFLTTMVDGELVTPFGVEFGPEQEAWLRLRNFIPVTCLARTEMAQSVGGFVCEPHWWDTEGNIVSADDPRRFSRWFGEEWQWQLRMLDAGAKFVHLPERTWLWHHHDEGGIGNTSGLPERW